MLRVSSTSQEELVLQLGVGMQKECFLAGSPDLQGCRGGGAWGADPALSHAPQLASALRVAERVGKNGNCAKRRGRRAAENIPDLVWYPGLRVIAEADFHPHLSFLLI